MTRAACAALVAILVTACSTADGGSAKAAEEARELIGKEYVSVLPDQRLFPRRLSCISAGGGVMSNDDLSESDWSWGLARCESRIVLMLERRVGTEGSRPRWRIVDALLLPPVTVTDPNPELLGLESAWDGTCELGGSPNARYFAAVRFGDRDRVDWRTGVEQAWTFDLQQGRIVPMSPEGIICERLQP